MHKQRERQVNRVTWTMPNGETVDVDGDPYSAGSVFDAIHGNLLAYGYNQIPGSADHDGLIMCRSYAHAGSDGTSALKLERNALPRRRQS